MPALSNLLALSLVVVLAACGGPATRYLVRTSPVSAQVPVKVRSIELRDVTLPAYGEGTQILRENADGGLVPIRGSEWADGSAHAITVELARSLDLRSSATVAAEPWPFFDPAEARIDVRLERVEARADGRFHLSGQFALSSQDGRIRDQIDRFDIVVPMADSEPPQIAAAYGAALDELGKKIIARLAR